MLSIVHDVSFPHFDQEAYFMRVLTFLLVVVVGTLVAVDVMATAPPTCKIVLIAGETAKVDKPGHHDYLAGVACLEALLRQTPEVETIVVTQGWPEQDDVFEGAAAVVFYTDGGGKQAFLASTARVSKMQSLADSGVGIVMLHQAVDFPEAFAKNAKDWLGGLYLSGHSGRGHWDSKHVDFPNHPICQGVIPWQVNDGWLNKIEFVENMLGVTPLVWSGKEYAGSRAGLDDDIVAWAYQRPGGGRSFSYTGLDAHSAWSLEGMRQLVVNGVLWSASQEIPKEGAANGITEQQLDALLTPRTAKPAQTKKTVDK